MLITVWLLFDEFMGHVVLNDVLCVSSGALYTTHALCGWLRDTDKECCCSGDSLPYYHRVQSPVNMTTLLLGELCCTSTAVAR